MTWRAISLWPYSQMFRAMNLTKEEIKNTGGSPEELVAASVLKSTLALDALGEAVRDTLQGGGMYGDWDGAEAGLRLDPFSPHLKLLCPLVPYSAHLTLLCPCNRSSRHPY